MASGRARPLGTPLGQLSALNGFGDLVVDEIPPPEVLEILELILLAGSMLLIHRRLAGVELQVRETLRIGKVFGLFHELLVQIEDL